MVRHCCSTVLAERWAARLVLVAAAAVVVEGQHLLQSHLAAGVVGVAERSLEEVGGHGAAAEGRLRRSQEAVVVAVGRGLLEAAVGKSDAVMVGAVGRLQQGQSLAAGRCSLPVAQEEDDVMTFDEQAVAVGLAVLAAS